MEEARQQSDYDEANLIYVKESNPFLKEEA